MPAGELEREALAIVSQADQAGIKLRLLGGLAIWLTSPAGAQIPSLARSYADLDFVGLSRHNRKIKNLFIDLQYLPDERFNALHGRTRLLFHNPATQKHIDIFLDRFQMCHSLDLRERLFEGYHSLCLADLLTTKLQIVELNHKDMQDILTVLVSHGTAWGEHPDRIDLAYLGQLCAQDWGLYITLQENLLRTREAVADFLNAEGGKLVVQRIEAIMDALERTPKSLKWQLRARIGRRMEWYDVPDEVSR